MVGLAAQYAACHCCVCARVSVCPHCVHQACRAFFVLAILVLITHLVLLVLIERERLKGPLPFWCSIGSLFAARKSPKAPMWRAAALLLTCSRGSSNEGGSRVVGAVSRHR